VDGTSPLLIEEDRGSSQREKGIEAPLNRVKIESTVNRGILYQSKVTLP